MTINFDENALIAIYKEDTRMGTIKAIKEMMAHLEEDETELRTLSENSIKHLESLTEKEFNEIEFVLFS